MPQIRMIGLVLFITTVLLALAAAATKTTHIRIQKIAALPAGSQPPDNPLSGTAAQPFPPLPESAIASPTELPVEFTSVPVTWPLLAAGGFGMLLWFWQPSSQNRKPSSSRRRR